jgi:hypothetical protein
LLSPLAFSHYYLLENAARKATGMLLSVLSVGGSATGYQNASRNSYRESETICDEQRAMAAGFSNYMMNKPRSAEVERLKTFFQI